jgi:hypothetical protein
LNEVDLPPIQKSAFVTFLVSNDAFFQMADQVGLLKFAIDLDLNDFPADAVPVMRAFLLSRQRGRTSVREQDSVPETIREISLLSGMGRLPVTVIAADRWIDKNPDIAAKRAEWNKKHQRSWLAMSSNSRFMIVPGSDHLSLLSKKEHAAMVSDAIIRMVRKFRQK